MYVRADRRALLPGPACPNKERVLIIVPAHNESGSLPQLLRTLRERCPACDVLVIDDGSTDETRMLASEMARVISLPCNLGIGGAVQTGLQVALREGYEVAIQVDGDGQHPPQEVGKLLTALRESGCDLVIGSRFRRNEGFRSTASRRLGIRLFSKMLSWLCGTRITDPTSGFRAMNSRAIRLLGERYAEDFPEVEALVQLHKAGLHVLEVPVQMTRRTAGKSSIGALKALLYMTKVPLAIFMCWLRKCEVHPLD